MSLPFRLPTLAPLVGLLRLPDLSNRPSGRGGGGGCGALVGELGVGEGSVNSKLSFRPLLPGCAGALPGVRAQAPRNI